MTDTPKINTWDEAANAVLNKFGKRWRTVPIEDVNPNTVNAEAVITTEEGGPMMFYLVFEQCLKNYIHNSFWFALLNDWVEKVKACPDCEVDNDFNGLCPKHKPQNLEDLEKAMAAART